MHLADNDWFPKRITTGASAGIDPIPQTLRMIRNPNEMALLGTTDRHFGVVAHSWHAHTEYQDADHAAVWFHWLKIAESLRR
jgi:hypothetical protein